MHSLVTNQKGQGLTEYLILVLLVSVVSITIVRSLGGTVKKKFTEIEHHIDSDVVIRN